MKYKKLTVVSTFSIMFLGMVFFSTKNSTSRTVANVIEVAREHSTEVSDTKTSYATIESNGIESEDTSTAKGVSVLMKNAYPEINNLISNYLQARLKMDKEEMSKFVDDENYIGIENLSKINKKIEDIRLTSCYTLDGPEEEAVMVYASTKIKFHNIDTEASALDGFYVKKDKNGNYKIILSPLDNEVQKIIDEDIKRDDVTALLSDINSRFANEIRSDKKLKKLFTNLQKKKENK